jgi:hypothetical protein
VAEDAVVAGVDGRAVAWQTIVGDATAAVARERAAAIAVGGDLLFMTSAIPSSRWRRDRVPVLYPWRQTTAEGGLASYGTDYDESFRLAGGYTARVLQGEKPANLAVHQVTKMQLVINLKTAKTLDLTLPLNLVGRADEVIERNLAPQKVCAPITDPHLAPRLPGGFSPTCGNREVSPTSRRSRHLVPASAAVPTPAGNHEQNHNDDQKRRAVHTSLLEMVMGAPRALMDGKPGDRWTRRRLIVT